MIATLAMAITAAVTARAEDPDETGVTAYRCERGEIIVLERDDDGTTLHRSARSHALSPTDVGWRAADLTLRREADTLVLSDADGVTICKHDHRESRRQAARLAGMDVIAGGSEPHWRLAFNGSLAILETADDRRRFTGEDSGVDAASGSTALRFTDGDVKLHVQLFEEACRRADGAYEDLRVRARVGRTVLDGCGEALH